MQFPNITVILPNTAGNLTNLGQVFVIESKVSFLQIGTDNTKQRNVFIKLDYCYYIVSQIPQNKGMAAKQGLAFCSK